MSIGRFYDVEYDTPAVSVEFEFEFYTSGTIVARVLDALCFICRIPSKIGSEHYLGTVISGCSSG